MARISILGTGRMGAALATAFAKAGHTVTVWNRTWAKAKPLEAIGARVATSVVDALEADLVIDNVSDYRVSAGLVRTPEVERALRGKTFLELASGTPTEAQRSAAWASEHGIRYLDGAIMATPNVIGQPGCTILYSGPTDLWEAHHEARHLLDMSKEYGIDASLPEAVHRIFARAVEKGHSQDDISAAYEGIR